MYNEVIIDIQEMAKKYPRGIEAFVLDVSNVDKDCRKWRDKGVRAAQADQRAFSDVYGFEVPVLEMDLAAADPFRVPQGVVSSV